MHRPRDGESVKSCTMLAAQADGRGLTPSRVSPRPTSPPGAAVLPGQQRAAVALLHRRDGPRHPFHIEEIPNPTAATCASLGGHGAAPANHTFVQAVAPVRGPPALIPPRSSTSGPAHPEEVLAALANTGRGEGPRRGMSLLPLMKLRLRPPRCSSTPGVSTPFLHPRRRRPRGDRRADRHRDVRDQPTCSPPSAACLRRSRRRSVTTRCATAAPSADRSPRRPALRPARLSSSTSDATLRGARPGRGTHRPAATSSRLPRDRARPLIAPQPRSAAPKRLPLSIHSSTAGRIWAMVAQSRCASPRRASRW